MSDDENYTLQWILLQKFAQNENELTKIKKEIQKTEARTHTHIQAHVYSFMYIRIHTIHTHIRYTGAQRSNQTHTYI